ncbi:MAG: T9SS type A sorting domain-containing protein [Lewinellaceae bacterium]|nr:T9SS type A sorting domain-containing protein [Saprospiraceae bacterium]MCB9313073.1 T9SS type A sorting domain-containing protein [Lewinellaceae bacterium]
MFLEVPLSRIELLNDRLQIFGIHSGSDSILQIGDDILTCFPHQSDKAFVANKYISQISTDSPLKLLSLNEVINQENGTIHIYPNPMRNSFVLNHTFDLPIELIIVDQFGRIVFRENNVKTDSSINLSHVYQGLYHVICKNNSGIAISKITKL